MLMRFCLYGFLRNQRYFEPFLVLFFLDKGMSFFLIGLLIAFRELTVNLLEIPSGALADIFGRRRTMILSLFAYVGSFLVFGLAEHLALLFGAMFLFAIGESFRTGTHKAMIFQWLRQKGRTEERTKIYGYTRSWSKIGSAVSVGMAAGIVVWTEGYAYVFYFSAIPYVLGIINFLGYPRELEGEGRKDASIGRIVRHLRDTLRGAYAESRLRRLVLESMGFEGVFHSVKDYLQPVLLAAAVPLAGGVAVASEMSEPQKVALLAAPVYLVLHLLSAYASRCSHRVAKASGGEDQAARLTWGVTALIFVGLGASGYFEALAPLIVGFILLHVVHNLWRPIQVGRFEPYGGTRQGATVLSVESQARRVTTMLAAPLLGLVVDAVVEHQIGGTFWPIGVLGMIVGVFFFSTCPKTKAPKVGMT